MGDGYFSVGQQKIASAAQGERGVCTCTSCTDLSVWIVTKSPKVGPLLIFSISLCRPVRGRGLCVYGRQLRGRTVYVSEQRAHATTRRKRFAAPLGAQLSSVHAREVRERILLPQFRYMCASQCFGSGLIESGSGSRYFANVVPVRIQIQTKVLMTNFFLIYS